ncbi:tRNA pseudouridine(38-40) synthase TruA [Alicyclobacillus sp. SO9]|uniref:tRNA pseudouridine(38-40) synthase TruA n=1 Tax=Alicyclobacillus sp. SO9 TaxID=2665646 RepID=UPI001E59992D|nr:tRNA pseudouridine(38-40) synthase TruA [Alicyclobacillus sp. SO9]
MTKIKLVVSYDGTDFHGFARQPKVRTVQGELESTLTRLLTCPTEVVGSGRTDAGVHAKAQVVHFHQDKGPEAKRYPYILRRSLPKDIVVTSACEVDSNFHARFSAVGKTYRYTLQTSRVEDIFTSRYAWHVPGKLNLNPVERALPYFIGEHDFTSFCASATPVKDKVRRLTELRLEAEGSFVHVYCSGTGFLQYMVRIIVGTLVDIGRGRLHPDSIPRILEARDRRLAGQTAPPNGLILWKVHYGEEQSK